MTSPKGALSIVGFSVLLFVLLAYGVDVTIATINAVSSGKIVIADSAGWLLLGYVLLALALWADLRLLIGEIKRTKSTRRDA